jgi:hypothetical protein
MPCVFPTHPQQTRQTCVENPYHGTSVRLVSCFATPDNTEQDMAARSLALILFSLIEGFSKLRFHKAIDIKLKKATRKENHGVATFTGST